MSYDRAGDHGDRVGDHGDHDHGVDDDDVVHGNDARDRRLYGRGSQQASRKTRF